MPKLLPRIIAAGGTREAVQAEGTAAYKLFISTLLDITDNLGADNSDHPARQRRAPRRRRSLSGGRRRQGHRDVLRHRQRDRRRASFLARRCLRVRRLGRLRPQEDGHHRARRLGIGEAPLPRDGRRHRHARRSPSWASATCRATCSATACCARRPSSSSPPSTTATSSSIPRPTRNELRRAAAPVRPAALELAGLRQVADLARRRRVLARRQGDRARRRRRRPRSASPRREATPQEVMNAILKAPVDLIVLRRHRHLCAGVVRDRRGRRRPRQRRHPRHRRRSALQGDRRGRQSRHDPARPRRGGDARRAAQHRRHRQLGRRQHLRPRGQHQDRAGHPDARRPAVARRRATRCSPR